MFDLFNREALRAKSAELNKVEWELVEARSRIDELKAEVNALTAKVHGDRVCDGYCENCVHEIKTTRFHPLYGETASFSCELDCKCKGFEKKEC